MASQDRPVMGLVAGALCDWDVKVVSGLSLLGNHDEKYQGPSLTAAAERGLHEKGKNKRPKMHNAVQPSLVPKSDAT
jgi:hypothetical protein